MASVEQSSVNVLIVSPNLLKKGTPNGVADFITGLQPYLEKEGCVVRLVGPAESTAAHYTLGRTFRVTHDGTTHESAVSVNKSRARQILLHTSSDLIVAHQPLDGNLAHILMSASPKREDGKRSPAFIGHFHANAENLDTRTKLALEAGKYIRRVKFGKWGFPAGFTPGYLNTVMGGLDGRIAVSNATARFWEGIYEGDHEYNVIYNGIDVSELTPEGERIDEWDEDGKKTILFAGRHDPRKGIEYLLEAYRVLSLGNENIKLKITGNGQETDSLRRFVQRRNLHNVEFLGVITREDLIKAYRTADVFVSPATGGEGFGRTLAEAMACGTLTVGSDIEGYREVIGSDATNNGEFASMAKPKDPDDLALHIGRMLNISEQNKLILGRQAAEYVRNNFSWPIIARQTVKYYNEVLSQHGMPNKEQWPNRKKQKNKLNLSGDIFVGL